MTNYWKDGENASGAQPLIPGLNVREGVLLDYTDEAVAAEATSRTAADAALQTQISNAGLTPFGVDAQGVYIDTATTSIYAGVDGIGPYVDIA